jgi:hypothetical protein
MPEEFKPTIHFETQGENEEIIFVLRAHVFTNLRWVVLVAILFLIPVFVTQTNIFDPILNPLQISSTSARSLALGWYFLTFAIAIQGILHWYFNVYILTNKRLVDIDFQQLLYRKISSTELSNVEDITYTKGGIAQSMLNYGDLHIQTAGTLPQFEFIHIPDPGSVQKKIEKSVGEYKNGL